MEELELGKGEIKGAPKSQESSIEEKSIEEIVEMMEGGEIEGQELGSMAIEDKNSRAKIRSAMEAYIARHRGELGKEPIKKIVEEITIVDFLEALK
jgi:hypothetical protein